MVGTVLRVRKILSLASRSIQTGQLREYKQLITMANISSKKCNRLSLLECVDRNQHINNITKSQISVDSGMASAPSTPSTPTSPIDFEVRIATEADSKRMVEFLRKFFFRDEPLNKYLGVVTEQKPINEDLEKFACTDMGDPSIIAEMDGKLIGVCLNGILTKDAKDDDFVPSDKEFAKIFNLLNYVAEQSDPFKHFPGADKAMTLKIISVDDTYRGKGIAKQLMAKTKEIAREKGCGFMTVDCTSHFTALALKRLGFNQIYALNYSDYKPDGEVVFVPEPPHKAVTVYVQKL